MVGLPDSCTVEIEFTAGTWTDVTTYVSATDKVSIRAGRSTEFDDVGPSTCTLVLWNSDGRFTPDSAGSPYCPDVIEGKRLRVTIGHTPAAGSTTGFTGLVAAEASAPGTLWPGLPTDPDDAGVYRLFTGAILSWEPNYSTGVLYGGTVTVTAVDALATLALHTFDDRWTEEARHLARSAGTWADVFVLTGDATTRAWGNVGEADGGTYGTSTLLIPTTGVGEVTYGAPGTITLTSAATFKTADAVGRVIDIAPQSAPQSVAFWLQVATDSIPATNTAVLVLRDSGGVRLGSLRLRNDAGATDLTVYDALGTGLLATLVSGVNDGAWRRVTLTPSSTSTLFRVDTDTVSASATVAFDMTSATHVYLAGDKAGPVLEDCSDVSIAGVVVAGGATVVPAVTVGLAGQTYTPHTGVFTALQNYVPEVTAWATAGGESRTVGEPVWAGSTALDVLQVLARTINGVAYVTGAGTVTLAAADVVRPTISAATIDIEKDLDVDAALPTLRRAADSRPTRVTIDYAGGTTTLIDAAAEANGQPRREQSLKTCAADTTGATFAGSYLLQAANGLRITQVAVDLTTSVQDLWATFLGLYPTQRVTIGGFDAALIGEATKVVYVQGWRVDVDHQSLVYTLDCSPASQFAGASWDVGEEYGRWSAGSTMTVTAGTAVGTTANGTLVITTTGTTVTLTTDPADYPLYLDWNGEVVQVTSPPGGSSSPQTVTTTARGAHSTAARSNHVVGESLDVYHAAIFSF